MRLLSVLFCCAGCARVYEVALENNMLDQVRPKPKPPAPILDLSKTETTYFYVDGMWCAGCATAAEHVLRTRSGIRQADISFAAERGRIQYDPGLVDPAAVLGTLDSLGYRARLLSDPSEKRQERQQ
jgi:copper chaperone CopZ